MFRYGVGVGVALGLLASAWGEGQEVQVAEIRAHLFYQNLGRLSENILDNPDFNLWNVMIGGGSAEGYAQATLVVVAVQAPPMLESERYKVQVDVFANNEIIAMTRQPITMVGEERLVYVPVLVDNTGCTPLRVKARIIGQGEPSVVEKLIPFRCGE